MHPVKQLKGRAAAVISNAVERHHGVFRCHFLHPSKAVEGAHVDVVSDRDPVGGNRCTVGTFPVEQTVGHIGLFVGTGSHENVRLHAAVFQNHGNGAVVTEGVHVVADFCGSAQIVPEKPLGNQTVAGKGFAGGNVAVGLNVPAAGDAPSAFRDSLTDFLKHIRITVADPFVIGGAGGGELEIREFLHPVKSGAEGRLYFRVSFMPLPEPYRVKMGISDEMYFHIVLLVGQIRYSC